MEDKLLEFQCVQRHPIWKSNGGGHPPPPIYSQLILILTHQIGRWGQNFGHDVTEICPL